MNFSDLFVNVSLLIALKNVVVGFGLCVWSLYDPTSFFTLFNPALALFIVSYSYFFPAFGLFFSGYFMFFPMFQLSWGLRGAIDLFYCMGGLPNDRNYIFIDDGSLMKLSFIELQYLNEAVYCDRESLLNLYTNMDSISYVDTTHLTHLPNLLII